MPHYLTPPCGKAIIVDNRLTGNFLHSVSKHQERG
jgi:hypothetical protein